jgi:DNA polymerase I-like protein with 3'-5' exonuclease and polymerase domains
MLAHYMNNDAFTNEVVNGDPHTANMNAAGLSTRSQAKTFIYAFLYGAGAEKIGSIVGGSAKTGAALKNRFLTNMPDLKKLQEQVIKKASQYGYVNGLDGRRIHIRSPHAGLNTLLQGAGAIVCKQWAIEMDRRIRAEKLEAQLVCSVHDQYIYEVGEKSLDIFKKVCEDGIKQAGQRLNLRCPLACDVGVGSTWYDAEH